MSSGGTPDPDAFTLDRVGRGIRGRGPATTLERRQGEVWVTVGRYSDRVAASQALDAAIADRGSLNDYRLVSEDRRGVQRWLMIGVVVLAVVVVLSLWQIVD